MAFWKKDEATTKRSETWQRHDTARSGPYLPCKRKTLQTQRTRQCDHWFSAETWHFTATREPYISSVFNRFSPFSEDSCRRLLDTCSFSDAKILLWAESEGERTQKGVDTRRQKGRVYLQVAVAACFHSVLWPVAEWKVKLFISLATWSPSPVAQAPCKCR